MTDLNILPALEYSTDIIIDRVLSHDRRVLLFGEPANGKSTLATELAGYKEEPERVYEEVRAVCSRVVVPR